MCFNKGGPFVFIFHSVYLERVDSDIIRLVGPSIHIPLILQPIWLPLICRDDGMIEFSCPNPAVHSFHCFYDPCNHAWQSISFWYWFIWLEKFYSTADFFSSPICLSYPGGFIFKQWKKRFLLLTAEGSLLVCHDASSPPDQLVLLQSSCEAIVEGKEILDLPKLPSGGCRDCCFALILPQSKYLLLLADTPADCRSLCLSEVPQLPPVTVQIFQSVFLQFFCYAKLNGCSFINI